MRYEAVAVVGAVLMLASIGSAGEVYRWTDANGVLHISDVPPAGQRAQKQTLPDAPPLVAPAAGAPPGDGAVPAEGTPAAGQKPAQVVITGQDNESVGGSQHVVCGTVENKGGTPARDVVIVVHVVSPAQGDECLEEEIAVASSLAPGEKAEFSEEFDHPCFRGPTQVDLRPQWE
jgi:hypothetical protein